MGKATFVVDPKTKHLEKLKLDEKCDLSKYDQVKEYRQFMVRRRKHLEIMYTNGIVYWNQKVAKSEVKTPYFIQDIIMDKKCKTLLSYHAIPGHELSF